MGPQNNVSGPVSFRLKAKTSVSFTVALIKHEGYGIGRIVISLIWRHKATREE